MNILAVLTPPEKRRLPLSQLMQGAGAGGEAGVK
jgi:hypothetical protein